MPVLPVSEHYLQVFEAMFRLMNASSDGRFHSSQLTSLKSYGYTAAIIRPALSVLCDKGYLNHTVSADRSTANLFGMGDKEFWELTPSGAEFAVNLKFQLDSKLIPAADRFVSTKDNQIDTSQAVAALDELTEAIRTSNELTANSEDKLQISREISFLKEVIEQPRLHIAALYDAKVNTTLRWLTEQAFSAIVRQAAVRVMQNLDKLWEIVKPHL